MIVIRLLLAIVFAILFAALVFGLEAGLFMAIESLFNTRMMPRGLGWVAMPFFAGVAGWKFGWEYEILWALGAMTKSWLTDTRNGRAFLVLSGFWIVGWSLYCWLSGNFGNYYYGWSQDDWIAYVGGLFGLPILALVIWQAFRWVRLGETR